MNDQQIPEGCVLLRDLGAELYPERNRQSQKQLLYQRMTRRGVKPAGAVRQGANWYGYVTAEQAEVIRRVLPRQPIPILERVGPRDRR